MQENTGAKQERLLFDHLRFHRHCHEVVQGDNEVRRFLEMKGQPKCADALGLHRPLDAPGPRRITVAESKGTDMGSAIEQLGNAAAGVFEKFGRETTIDLLLVVPALVERPTGHLSPGHGYRAAPLKSGLDKYTLQESMGGAPFTAIPRVTYHAWAKWASRVGALRIVVLVMKAS